MKVASHALLYCILISGECQKQLPPLSMQRCMTLPWLLNDDQLGAGSALEIDKDHRQGVVKRSWRADMQHIQLCTDGEIVLGLVAANLAQQVK